MNKQLTPVGRMNQIMSKLQKYTEAEYTPFIRVLFGQSSPTPVPNDLNDPDYGLGDIGFVDPGLNDSQKEAIKFAMLSREVALIHGPPGVSNKTNIRDALATLTILDRKNAHIDRAHPSTPEAELTNSSVRSFEYLRGQHSRTVSTPQSTNDPFRPPSPASTIRPQLLS